MSERSERRRRRARTVRGLAGLLDGVARDGDERRKVLGWHALDELPDWCGLGPDTRGERCTLAGAVVLLPAIRRCLDGETLSLLRERVGAERFEALRRRPYRAFVRDAEPSVAPVSALDAQLAGLGARALVAEIVDPAVRALLHDALRAERGLDAGESDGPEGGANRDGPAANERPEVDPGAALAAAELHLLGPIEAATAPAVPAAP